ncbi:MAG: alpha/beta hydrolase [Rhodothermales bacterium]
MKKLLFALIVLVGGLSVAWVLGPRPSVELALRAFDVPDDLDAYLARSEARFSDIRPGTEKTIVWADPAQKRKTPLSVVYLHGYSATRQEVRPLCDTLAARLGANLFYTRLTGHGRSGEAMAEASVNDWLNDGIEALKIGRRLGERVVVVGTSTGATLATWLATLNVADDVLAVVLISPNYGPKDRNARFLLWPWGGALARLVVGDNYSWTPHNEEQARYWTTRYPSEALVTMMSLVDLTDYADLDAIRQPVLVLYSPHDEVVDVERIEARYAEIGSLHKTLVPIEEAGDPSHHVLAGAILSPDATEPTARLILTFLQPFLDEQEGE